MANQALQGGAGQFLLSRPGKRMVHSAWGQTGRQENSREEMDDLSTPARRSFVSLRERADWVEGILVFWACSCVHIENP